MPMIDVYAPTDLFPPGSDSRLGHELTMAVLRAEGVSTPGPFRLNNTAAFIHPMDPHAVHTAATGSARPGRGPRKITGQRSPRHWTLGRSFAVGVARCNAVHGLVWKLLADPKLNVLRFR